MNGTAATGSLRGQRFFSIVTHLREDITEMLKREFALLKNELKDKASCLGRQGAFIAAGGIVALVGAEFLLVAACAFAAYGLVQAGLSLMVAVALAFLAFGLILGTGGYLVLKKGIAAISKTSLAPEQTLGTVKEITRPDAHPIHVKFADGKADDQSAKIQRARAAAERKIQEVQTEAAELRARLTPKYMWAATCTAVNRRPQLTAGIGASLLALILLKIRRRHQHA